MSGPGGTTYAVKLINNPQSVRVLFNETVCGRLAAVLRAPCAAVRIVDVSPEAAEGVHFSGNGQQGSPGLSHGSQWIADIDPVTDLSAVVAMNGNLARYTSLAILFTIVGNTDPQYVFDKDEPHRLYSVDHGHCFGSHQWTPDSLAGQSLPTEMENRGGFALDGDTKKLLHKRLRTVTPHRVARTLRCIPGTWQVRQADRVAAARYLWQRLRTVLVLLENSLEA